MKVPFVARLLTITLYAVFALGAFLVISLPFLLDHYMLYLYDAYWLRPSYRTFILSFLIAAGILGLWIVVELIGMMRTIPNDPFIQRNVHALRRMGFVALATAGLFFAKCLYYVTPLTMGCGVVVLVCSMFAFTLANLFRQAVAYKEENDLTI